MLHPASAGLKRSPQSRPGRLHFRVLRRWEALSICPKQHGTGRSTADIAARSKAAKGAKGVERPSQAGKAAVPTAAQKRKQREADAQELAKRLAIPVEQRRAEAEARELREAEGRATAKRVREEVAEEERERAAAAKQARGEQKQLKDELNAWEAQHQRKLKREAVRPALRSGAQSQVSSVPGLV